MLMVTSMRASQLSDANCVPDNVTPRCRVLDVDEGGCSSKLKMLPVSPDDSWNAGSPSCKQPHIHFNQATSSRHKKTLLRGHKQPKTAVIPSEKEQTRTKLQKEDIRSNGKHKGSPLLLRLPHQHGPGRRQRTERGRQSRSLTSRCQ